MKNKIIFIVILLIFFGGVLIFLLSSENEERCLTYDDYEKDVSIYDYQFLSEKDNVCLTKTTDQLKGNMVTHTLIEMFKYDAEDFYKNKFNLNDSCNIKVEGNKERLKLEDFYVGYLISYSITSDCVKKEILTLQCSSLTDCIIK